MTAPTNTTKPAGPNTLDQIEKAAAWVIGLLSTVAGSVTAAEGVLPRSVSTVLVATLPALVAVERYLTNK